MEEKNTLDNKTDKEEIIKISKTRLWQIISGVLFIVLIISIYTGGFKEGINGNIINDNSPPSNPSPGPSPTPSPTGDIDMKTLIDDDAIEGNEKASVTIVEFSDYECPFCERFYSQTLGQIRKEYIETGKVKLVYRDFPLSFHQQAQKAAEAAECAGEQGKYYKMHDMLFEKGVSGGIDSFKKYAKDIGLDTSKFNDCLDSGKMASEVQKDFNDGQQVGIQGTPGFIINGQLISGAQPYSVFKQAIDAGLV